MSLTSIDSLIKNPSALLSDILAHYLDVSNDFIMSYLTEHDRFTSSLADANMISISDMIDIIQRNLKFNVSFKVKDCMQCEDMTLMNTEVAFIDNGRNYILPLIWCLDN